MLKLFFSLALGLIFASPAISQTATISCSTQNMKYWSLLILENKAKEVVQYDLKINDDSPTGYLGNTKNIKSTAPFKHAEGSISPTNSTQNNLAAYFAFSCTKSPINITFKAIKNKTKTTCKVQIDTNGNVTAKCPADSFVSSGPNQLMFK